MKSCKGNIKKAFIGLFMMFMMFFNGHASLKAHPSIPVGQVDIFVRADFNYVGA